MSESVPELEQIHRALRDPDPSGRSEMVREYEEALARAFDAANAVALNSGSAALEATLIALGHQPGRTVLVSAAAPLPTLMPLLAAGANLAIVDCCPDNPGMDPSDLRRQLGNHPDSVAAIEVPLWGYPLAREREVLDVLATHGVPLIEDAAHAHGATVWGQYVGTLGAAGCFSTHRMKMLSTGEGGFVLAASTEVAERVRGYSRLSNLDGERVGRNFKPSAFTAALGLARLPALRSEVDGRRARAKALLGALPEAMRLELSHVGLPNYYNLVVLVWDLARAQRLHLALGDEGIQTDPVRFRYKAATDHPLTNHWARECPNARGLVTAAVQLPVDQESDPLETAERVARAWSRS